MIEFFVAGIPKAMSVGKTVRAGTKVFQGRRHSDWATLVGMIGREHAPDVPLEGPVSVIATFFVPRPKNARGAAYPIKRPDTDNLVHKLTDQFNGVFWRDDSQVVAITASKHYETGRPGVKIRVDRVVGPSAAQP